MRSILCLLVVCLFATTAAAQFKAGVPARNTAPAADGTQKKAANEKARPGKAPAADQAAAETELANAILVAMDADHDGMVTKLEYKEAFKALAKVHKDKQGNMVVPDTAAADAGPAVGQGPGGAGATATADGRNNNEAMGRFMQMDANHDGRLTVDEVPPNVAAMLRGADLNNDKAIDAREMQAFIARMGDRARAFTAGGNPNGAGGTQGNGRKP